MNLNCEIHDLNCEIHDLTTLGASWGIVRFVAPGSSLGPRAGPIRPYSENVINFRIPSSLLSQW